MAMAAKNTYELIEGLLDHGLPFIASYLEKAIKRPIVITDSGGVIHYPLDTKDRVNSDVAALTSYLKEGEYYYHNPDGCLSYSVGRGSIIAYIFVKRLSKTRVQETVSYLSQAELAIECYFSALHKANMTSAEFEQELGEYLFYSNSRSIKEIFRLIDVDVESPYCVGIMKTDDVEKTVDWQEICSFFRQSLFRSSLHMIYFAWENCLIMIFPCRFMHDSAEGDPDRAQLRRCKEMIEKRYRLSLVAGIGQTYPLSEIKKSFREARIAVVLPGLLGNQAYIQHFAVQGIFTHIFSQNPDGLKEFCYKTLGNLLEYDKTNNGELLTTLRQLLDSSFNWKSTADRLFIHINTLYYRVNKIRELLNADLSRMDTRVMLYTAVKVWDTFNLI